MIFSNKTTNKSIRSLRQWMLILVASCVFSIEASAAGDSSQNHRAPAETKLTAIFLYQFSKFIEWPVDTHADRNAPYFTICIDNDLQLKTVLEKISAGESVGNRSISIKNLLEIPNPRQCQILYFSSANKNNLNILSDIDSKTTLTVTKSEAMLHKGSMIRLKNEGKRIRPQININAIKKTRITVSSKLLRISEVFTGE